MKCLILSDSHGNVNKLNKAISMHPDADIVFFLGDGLSDFEYVISKTTAMCLAVSGNCDVYPIFKGESAPKIDTISICGKKICFTHGDLYGVKYGDDGLYRLHENNGCDIILYGHTHIPRETYDNGLYLFNPGSISTNIGGKSSFGLLNITESVILFSHGFLY